MSAWKKVSGPRTYETGDGRDIDVNWGWTIGRGGEERTISVEVSGGLWSELPEHCQRAISTNGWSAIHEYLAEDVPPRRIGVTTDGLHPVYE